MYEALYCTWSIINYTQLYTIIHNYTQIIKICVYKVYSPAHITSKGKNKPSACEDKRDTFKEYK